MTTALILMYENFPCLYNVRSKDYHNRNLRVAAIRNICLGLKETYPNTGVTEAMVQKKIHGIRTQYNSEINKIKKSETSGASADDIYKPKLWCFEMLGFLRDTFNVVTKGESTLNLDLSSQVKYKYS